jgi:hypothetical protein
MSFRVVQGAVDEFWCASDGTSTYYMGQLVSFGAASKAATPGTVVPLAVPAGAADTTNLQVPAGVVTGFNLRTPKRDATTGLDYATGVLTQADQLARDWAFNGGMYAIGDPQLLVKVALINQSTLIEGPIYNAAYGTACTVVSDTGGADTTGYTTAGTQGTAPFTPVAYICTAYCRAGANAGLYRTTNDTSATAMDTTVAFPYDVALGDSFVRVPLKQGLSEIYIAGPGLYITQALTATNNFQVIVKKLDLTVSGKESAQFWFTGDHFCNERA